jgi:hypothetical protein
MKRFLGLALGVAVFAAACADTNTLTDLLPTDGLRFAHTGPLASPDLVMGNISGTADQVCAEVNTSSDTWRGFKIDSNANSNQNGIAVTITDGKYLAWASSGPTVMAVVIKGGPNTNVYYYNDPTPEADHDNGLVSPGSGPPDVSHYVVCYTAKLVVTKTAETSFDRTFEWTIEKTASEESILLSPTGTYDVDYEVVVTKSAAIDYGHKVYGVITVSNPLDSPVDVDDVLDSMFGADLDCEVSFPYTLAAGGAFECTYEVQHDEDGSNTATAVSGTTGVANGQATANFSFGDPANVDYDCVDVSDSMVGTTVTGNICASQTFDYTITFGPYGLPCGDFEVDNTAVVEYDGEELDSSTAIVDVTVAGEECTPAYCTLTQGYWKTHSAAGPAPYDAGWEELPGGQGHLTVFFGTSKTWLEVFNAPVRGAAGVSLAHQYMAAKLNVLNAGGATIPQDVLDALAAAETWFGVKPWTQVSAKLPKPESNTVNALASLLDDFNNGVIGAGHCSE